MRNRCRYALFGILLLTSFHVWARQAPLVGTGVAVGVLSQHVESTLLIGFQHDTQYLPLNLTFGVEAFLQFHSEATAEEGENSENTDSEISTTGILGLFRAGLRLINSPFLDFDAFGGVSLYSLMHLGDLFSPVYGAGINLHTGSDSSIRASGIAFCEWDDPEPYLVLYQLGLVIRY